MVTRQEHLDWAKKRALDYIENGYFHEAYQSMALDLRDHPETKNHSGIVLGLQLKLSGLLGDPDSMREFIEGFN